MQNRVSELYSLIRFLRLYPYAYYFCNSGRSKTSQKKKQEPCTCKSLDYSFKTNWRKCDHCGYTPSAPLPCLCHVLPSCARLMWEWAWWWSQTDSHSYYLWNKNSSWKIFSDVLLHEGTDPNNDWNPVLKIPIAV